MNGFRYKLYQFMQGRRGVDQFSRFLVMLSLLLVGISLFVGKYPVVYMITYFLGFASLIYGEFRIFSRNLYKRDVENSKYLAAKQKIIGGKTLKQRRAERKIYTFFKCPGCGQKMRAPKGKGSIRVTCHNCNTSFERKV